MATTSTYDRERKMMLDHEKWPCWPFLPVKRRNHKVEPNIGVMCASKEDRWTVYHINMFDMPRDLATASKSEYATVDALLADGWVVD